MVWKYYKEINQRLNDLYINDKRVSKKSRIENIVFNCVIPVSKADILDKLPDVSVTTIEKVLSDLLKQNKIKKIGNYKDAKYIPLSSNEDNWISIIKLIKIALKQGYFSCDLNLVKFYLFL